MNIEELAEMHRGISQWAGSVGIAFIASHALAPKVLEERLSFFNVPPTSMLSLIRDVFSRNSSFFASQSPQGLGRLGYLGASVMCDMDDLRKVDLNANNPEQEDIRSFAKKLGMGKDRDAWLLETFGALYDVINMASNDEITEIRRQDAITLYRKQEEMSGFSNKRKAQYAWALLASGDRLKQALAIGVIAGPQTVDPNHAKNHINALYLSLEDSVRNRREADKQANRHYQDVVVKQSEIGRIKKEFELAKARIAELEQRVEKPSSEKAALPPKDADEIYVGLIQIAEEERDAANEKLGKANQMIRRLNAQVSNLMRKDASTKGLANGSGLIVYAGPEFVERYQKHLMTYTDNSLDGSFSDALDGIIKQLCHRIHQGGKSIERTEFEYMPEVKCHFLKINSGPAARTRIFFTTDFESRLTIYDVTTPSDHDEHFQKDSGRYKAIMSSRVSYTFHETKHCKLEKSVRELL